MNDKKQLAAMGEHLAEQQQPICLQKRVEQLEAQIDKPTNRLVWRNIGYPNGLRRFMTQKQYDAQTPGVQKFYEPIQYEIPEGWQLVPAEVVTPELSWPLDVGVQAFEKADVAGCELTECIYDAVKAMLSAAPKFGGDDA